MVNLASISSWIAQSNMFPHSATKAAILQLTRNMAIDLAPWAIRVNRVCPGTIVTGAVERYMEDRGMTVEQLNADEGLTAGTQPFDLRVSGMSAKIDPNIGDLKYTFSSREAGHRE